MARDASCEGVKSGRSRGHEISNPALRETEYSERTDPAEPHALRWTLRQGRDCARKCYAFTFIFTYIESCRLRRAFGV